MNRSTTGGFLLGLFLLFGPEDSQATLVMRLSFEEVVQHATRIVIGDVVRINKGAGTPQGGVRTEIEIEVVEHLGMEGTEDSLVLVFPGGSRDGMEYRVAGVPQFALKERLVLFLEPVPGGFTPVGWSQGIFTVGGSAGNEWVEQPGEDGHYVERHAGSGLRAAPIRPTHAFPLDAFRKQIGFQLHESTENRNPPGIPPGQGSMPASSPLSKGENGR